MRLLLIEDDADLVEALKLHFARDGYDVDACDDGGNAAYYLAEGGYNAVILDRMLPGRDGLSILSGMRDAGDMTPVLMLTALDAVEDRTRGLDAGADDYLVKPFAMPELLSRIRALLRRPGVMRETGALTFRDCTLNVGACSLACGETVQTLSRKETALLELFFENPDRVLSRAEILARVWGGDEAVEAGNVDNYIYFVRRRLKAAGGSAGVKTIHGVGYRLTGGNG